MPKQCNVIRRHVQPRTHTNRFTTRYVGIDRFSISYHIPILLLHCFLASEKSLWQRWHVASYANGFLISSRWPHIVITQSDAFQKQFRLETSPIWQHLLLLLRLHRWLCIDSDSVENFYDRFLGCMLDFDNSVTVNHFWFGQVQYSFKREHLSLYRLSGLDKQLRDWYMWGEADELGLWVFRFSWTQDCWSKLAEHDIIQFLIVYCWFLYHWHASSQLYCNFCWVQPISGCQSWSLWLHYHLPWQHGILQHS